MGPPTGQPSEPKFLDTWLGRFVSVVTIVGAIVGAWWGYTRWLAEDAPALELRPKTDGDLNWYRRAGSDAECIAEFKVSLENIGKRTIELTEATVSAWSLDISLSKEKKIEYVDPLKLTKGITPVVAQAPLIPPTDQKDEKGAYLRTYYPPGVADDLGMMFVMQREPGKIIVLLAEGKYRIKGANEQEYWFWHDWDEVCGLESLSKAAADGSARPQPAGRPLQAPRSTE
jgi:hypothetical protein